MKSFYFLFSVWVVLSVQNLDAQPIDRGSLGFEIERSLSPDLYGQINHFNGSMGTEGYRQNQTGRWQVDGSSTIIGKANTGTEKTRTGGLGLTEDSAFSWDRWRKGVQTISVENAYQTLLDSQREEYSSQLLARWENNPKDVLQSLHEMLENLYQYSTDPNETPPQLVTNFGTNDGNQLRDESFTICPKEGCATNGGAQSESGEGSHVKCPSLECAKELINMATAKTLCEKIASELFQIPNECTNDYNISELTGDLNSGKPFLVKVIPDKTLRNRAHFNILLFGPSSSLTNLDTGFECIDIDIYYYVGFDGLPGRIVDINTLYVGGKGSACRRQANLKPKHDEKVENGLIQKLVLASEKAWVIDTSAAIIANK